MAAFIQKHKKPLRVSTGKRSYSSLSLFYFYFCAFCTCVAVIAERFWCYIYM